MAEINKDILSRVDYIDCNFAKLFNIDGKYYDIVKKAQLDEKIELGDIVYYEYDENHNKFFKLHNRAIPRGRMLDEICLITDIDKYHVYLLQNGKSKTIKLERPEEDFEINDLVYLSFDEKNIIKETSISRYFKKVLNEFGKDIKAKGNFSIARVTLTEFQSHAVCVSRLSDLENFVIETDDKFEQNINYGDIYFDIRLGKNQKYVLDEDNANDLNNFYSSIIKSPYPISKNPSKEEALERTQKLLNYYYEKKAKMEKVGKKSVLNLPYDEADIFGEFYLDELEEDISGKYYRAINYNEDDSRGEIKIYTKDLPSIPAREGDSIVMTKDELGKAKFYFTNKFVQNSLQEKIEREEKRLSYLNKGGVWR